MSSLDLTSNTVAAASLADYTRPALLIPRLREHDTAGIISELSQALQWQGCIPDMLPFCHAALNQELLANSALECGMAFPHARMGGIKQVRFALGRAGQPVAWGVRGSWPVQFIFLLAVPATDAARYLPLLAGLGRFGQRKDLLADLLHASTAEGMMAVLEKVQMRPRCE